MEIEDGWHEKALLALLKEIPRKEAIADWLLEQERWEVFSLLFGESDTVSHHFWMFHDEASPRFRDEPALRDAIGSVYQALDAALGRLIEKAQPDWVLVASDHGFGGSGDQVLYLNRFLEKHGWLHYKNDPYRSSSKGIRSGSGLVDRAKAAALKRLPASVQQALVRRIPGSWLGSLETHSRYGNIDFRRTRAFSDEMNYAATLHLNIAGRDPSGTVEDRNKSLTELKKLLLSWEENGQPVVKHVWSREEVYTGEAVEWSPDLVLELHEVEGYTYTLLPSARVPKGCTWRRLEKEEHAGGKGRGMNGSHRQHGVLVLWGEGVKRGSRIEAGMADCLPTLFALMGHPLPHWWEGRVLREGIESVSVLWTEEEQPDVGSQAPLNTSDAAEVKARLESLGYL